jgi:hypothetical protein
MAATRLLKLRLLRDNPLPPGVTDGDDVRCAFGLQDNKGQLHDLLPRSDGKLAVDFDLRVASPIDETQPPLFLGPFAFGTPQDRFVYLSWQRPGSPGYVNRVKARLADIDWTMIRAAQENGGRLEADLSGRKAGGGKLPVAWRLVED